MSKFDHWMRFNVGDYLSDTMHLSTFQHGIYMLLIMHYFKHGGLPAVEVELARTVRIPLRQWRQQSPPVLRLFKVVDGGLRHTRVDAEREHARGVAEVKRRAANERHRSQSKPAGNGHSASAYAEADAVLAGGRARPTLDPEPRIPPVSPPENGGTRGRGNGKGRSGKPARNGFCDVAADMILERDDVEAAGPRPGGARVVDFPRSAGRGLADEGGGDYETRRLCAHAAE